MPRQVVPEDDEDDLEQLALEDRSSPSRLPVAHLVHATSGSTAATALARASPVQLVQHILAIAHAARRLLHWLAVLSLVAQLALVGRNPGDSSML